MAISYISHVTATPDDGSSFPSATVSATLPTFIAGDLAVSFAYNTYEFDAIVTPSGWTVIGTANTPSTHTQILMTIAYRILQTGDTSVTWSQATDLDIMVFRGCAPTNPIGSHAINPDGSSNTMSYLSLALAKADGSSAVVGGGLNPFNCSTLTASGMTLVADTSTDSEIANHYTLGVSAFSGVNWSPTSGGTDWMTGIVELFSIPHIKNAAINIQNPGVI